MASTRLGYKVFVLAIAAVTANVQGSPLFESDDTLVVTIEAPMRELLRHKSRENDYDAVLSYTDAAGVTHRLDFVLTTRGRSRLEICDFPPLRLTFNRDVPKATVFEGQRRLKMVTQCKGSNSGRDWLLQELGIYRAYNVITDYSYRVRRLEVTYRDTESTNWQRVQPAFLIEHIREAAGRLQRKSIRPPQINPGQFSLTETTRNLLFQYLIANTDFSVIRGPSDEGCCHNGRVITTADQNDNWVVLPYDFDQAGIINTSYAEPHEKLPVSRVSTRLYRGFCWQNFELPQSIALFNENRSEITDALLPTGLGKNKRTRALSFIDKFFDDVNSPKNLEKKILGKCR